MIHTHVGHQDMPKAVPDLDKNNQQMRPPSQGGTSGNKDPHDGLENAADEGVLMVTPQHLVSPRDAEENEGDEESDEDEDELDEDDD